MFPINPDTTVQLDRTIFPVYKLKLPQRSGNSQINARNFRIAFSVFSKNSMELSNSQVTLNLSYIKVTRREIRKNMVSILVMRISFIIKS